MNRRKNHQNIRLEEGIHYYVENGLYVFTERYHRERGYCCDSGCRHCPYKMMAGEKESRDKKG